MASKQFSNRLKELRKRAGYTQKEVYEHFNIPQSTFSSWEVGKSEPSGEMLMQLCDFYKCDMMKEFSNQNNDIVTNTDLEILEKYHALDEHGKEMVDFTLSKEYERSKAEKKKEDNVVSMEVKESNTYEVNAAHADDYMGTPEELRQQEEDMINKAFHLN